MSNPPQIKHCKACDGTGYFMTEEELTAPDSILFHVGRPADECKICGGTGYVEPKETLSTESNWFVQHRLEWIAETLRIFGFINRVHIERKFGISTPQASADLQIFEIKNPGVVKYNRSSKRYEAASR